MATAQPIAASFRDPNGFLFTRDGQLYRQINTGYQADYDALMESGLYTELTTAGLLIPHQEVDQALAASDDAYKVIRPDVVPTISYPYEWSFSQLKAAALATLDIQKRAFAVGMGLKDSSAYNIQFVDGRAVLIDTLSFERYEKGTVWVPYRQFCQHFLAPLALMSYTDIQLGRLLSLYIDGVPLDLAANLLPRRASFRLSLLFHIMLHARSQRHYQDRELTASVKTRQVSRQSFLGLLDNLEIGIKKLAWNKLETEWAQYYEDDSYNPAAFAHKQQLVDQFITQADPATVWDLGANTGIFSRLASQRGIPTVAWDVDPGAVELNFRQVQESGETNLLPLILDLTNPSAPLGWAHRERMSFAERGPVDLVMALALVHHLAISNNVPLDRIAQFFATLGRYLIIEFVPKSDKKVQTLLATRVDIFDHYTEDGFEDAFSAFFAIERKERIQDSERVLYFMTVH